MSNANRPRIGCISMPCSPSVPPVMLEKRSASASSSSAIPSVTIRRVRSTPLITRKLVRKPSTVATRPATTSASTGSVMMPCSASSPARIGADAEERGMAERNDAGIAQDQIERQRKQRQPHDIGHDQIAGGKQERAGQRENPERDLARVPARVLPGVVSDVGLRGHGGAQRAAVRPNRPFGRQIRITIMMV